MADAEASQDASCFQGPCGVGYSAKCVGVVVLALGSLGLLAVSFERIITSGDPSYWVAVSLSVLTLWAPAPRLPKG